jgi:hypothetical protein
MDAGLLSRFWSCSTEAIKGKTILKEFYDCDKDKCYFAKAKVEILTNPELHRLGVSEDLAKTVQSIEDHSDNLPLLKSANELVITHGDDIFVRLQRIGAWSSYPTYLLLDYRGLSYSLFMKRYLG